VPVVGTAGHVDHGKSTLVHALTGTDPDRLAEEKRRGLTIDLGFAHLELPGGSTVGVVDVPGHARFLHNMLAGVHGLDAVLLVVAADEGVMPQTREHLDIVGLMGVDRVVVALTKTDLVDEVMLDLAKADVRAELERRGIEADVVAVSVHAGRGLPQLVSALEVALTAAGAPAPGGPPRLPVDRAFSIKGFGTVVTGTLVDGPLRVGDQLHLLPALGRPTRVRVRGLQQHGVAVEVAGAGSRVAANLQGIDHRDVRRGQVLAPEGSLRQTLRLDARVNLLHDPAHGARVRVHSGTAEVPARLVRLDQEWVQLRLAAPLALREGDRFVLRRLSPAQTIGGGVVVDVDPAVHRRGDGAVVEALKARVGARARLLQEIARHHRGASLEALERSLVLPGEVLRRTLDQLLGEGRLIEVGTAFWTTAHWEELARTTSVELDAYHRRWPLRRGMPIEELRERLGVGRAAPDVVERLASAGLVSQRGRGTVSRPAWTPRLDAAQQALAEDLLARLRAAPLAPPRPADLGPEALVAAVCHYLEDADEVVRIGPGLWLLRETVEAAAAALRQHLEAHGAVTVAAARDVLGSSRRVVVPLLEHFDNLRLTRREGDTRRLR
jgi:selenocysteine-specific elongation factor